MDKSQDAKKMKVQIDPDEPVYVISVASKICHIPVWTLRELEKKGIIKPKRIGKKTRCYSMVQIQKLEYIHYLMEDRHINISAIKFVLEMEK